MTIDEIKALNYADSYRLLNYLDRKDPILKILYHETWHNGSTLIEYKKSIPNSILDRPLEDIKTIIKL